MLITSDLKPTGGFTQILNDAIFDERLTHAEFRLWCRLLALPRGAKQIHLDANEIAKELGMTPDLCRTQRRNLKEKGFLVVKRDRIVVTIPDEKFKVKEVQVSPEQQLRQDLKEAWNDSKPSSYPKLRNPLSAAQVETLNHHMRHNEQEDACQFLKTVLTGCRVESWWNSKSLTFDNIFGRGRPKENKFTNVQKLFRSTSSAKAQAALFDIDNDQCWLDWFQKKSIDMERVVRLNMERFAAWEHQTEHEGDKTLYIYTDERGAVVHWTYKEIYDYRVMYLPTDK